MAQRPMTDDPEIRQQSCHHITAVMGDPSQLKELSDISPLLPQGGAECEQ
jgi:hypothetical protein